MIQSLKTSLAPKEFTIQKERQRLSYGTPSFMNKSQEEEKNPKRTAKEWPTMKK